MRLKFDEDDVRAANEAWGCNCGPAALAAAFDMTLDEVRPHVTPFEDRGYMNVTNMRDAISRAGGRILGDYRGSWPPTGIGLVRVQFGGPWIIDGRPARWAARATHWVAVCRSRESHLYVFDVNAGLLIIDLWESDVIPAIIASIKRADGTWFITHSFGVERL